MKRTLGFTLAALFAVLLVRVSAITDGMLDGDRHPAVVLIVMDVGGKPAYRCSGTLLSPTIVVTAGHCTSDYPDEPYSGMRIFTESDVEAGIGTTNNYPYLGKNSVEALSWAAHPLFETGPFVLHDVGVIRLKGSVKLPDGLYGVLPKADMLDDLKVRRGQVDQTFTAVGYGLQQSFPDATSYKDSRLKTRYYATPYLLQINTAFVGDFSMLLSNNAYSGGTCFGDSGGPNFLGSGRTETKIIAGVTSYGINSNCAGTGGVFRLDRQDVLDFINGFMATKR
jgi:hypothetical protein